MPHILLDCEKMKYANTGLFEFCRQLGNSLIRQHTENESLTFYTPAALKGIFGPEQRYRIQRGYHRFLMPPSGNINIWHSTFQTTHYRPSSSRTRHILTIHDLNYIHEGKSPARITAYLKKIQRNIDRADHVVTISAFVMTDVTRHLELHNKPASVILNGGDLDTFPGFDQPAYRPQRPFLFAIGSINAKKNFHVLPALLKNNDYELILAGPVFDPLYKQKIQQEAAAHNVTDRVRILGSISGQDKYWYYHHCTAFLFPSLAEGFGIPVVEAMSQGKPCFISDKTSLPEVGGEYCYYFQTFEPDVMQQVFINGLHDYKINNRADAIVKHAATLTYHQMAYKYLQVYRSLY